MRIPLFSLFQSQSFQLSLPLQQPCGRWKRVEKKWLRMTMQSSVGDTVDLRCLCNLHLERSRQQSEGAWSSELKPS